MLSGSQQDLRHLPRLVDVRGVPGALHHMEPAAWRSAGAHPFGQVLRADGGGGTADDAHRHDALVQSVARRLGPAWCAAG